MTTFIPLKDAERQKLREALYANAERNTAILTDPVDTTFAGSADEVGDEEVISAIKSVPIHYSA